MPRSCGRGWRSCAAARRGGRRPSARCWRSRAGTPTTGRPTRRCRCPVTAVHARGLPRRPAGGPRRSGDHAGRHPRGLPRAAAPYQQRGLSWLAFLAELGLGACLADDMGLGKTVQLLALEAHERAAPAPAHPAAVPDVAGRHVAAGGGAVRPRAAGAARCTGPAARAAPRCTRRSRPPTWSSPPTPPPPATSRSWPRSPGGGSCSTRPRPSRTAGRRRRGPCAGSTPSTGSRSPAPRWRTGCRSSGR